VDPAQRLEQFIRDSSVYAKSLNRIGCAQFAMRSSRLTTISCLTTKVWDELGLSRKWRRRSTFSSRTSPRVPQP